MRKEFTVSVMKVRERIALVVTGLAALLIVWLVLSMTSAEPAQTNPVGEECAAVLPQARFRNESTPDVFVEGTVALASYPRSGNSLMRLLLEKTTGVWTGSIYHDRRLIEQGWRGESVYTSSHVVFVKTHDPMFERYSKPNFVPSRVVYLVRNPLDAIWSHFSLEVAGAHNQDIAMTGSDNSDKWARFVVKHTKLWREHIAHWQGLAATKPTLFVRYEDLVADGATILSRVLDFSLVDYNSVIHERIDCAVQTSIGAGDKQVGGYRPRKHRTSWLFTAEQIQYVLRHTFEDLCSLGYSEWLQDQHHLICHP